MELTTLSFDAFWSWLRGHGNCMVRVSTPDSVLYDDDDLHWWVGEENGVHLIQVIHGKRLQGEVVVDPERVAYVQVLGEQAEGEFAFELISETPTDRIASYQIVLVHGLEDEDDGAHGPAVH